MTAMTSRRGRRSLLTVKGRGRGRARARAKLTASILQVPVHSQTIRLLMMKALPVSDDEGPSKPAHSEEQRKSKADGKYSRVSVHSQTTWRLTKKALPVSSDFSDDDSARSSKRARVGRRGKHKGARKNSSRVKNARSR